MKQAPIFDGLSLDPFARLDDGFRSAEGSVGGRYVVQVLVVALVIIVLNEGLDLGLEVAGQDAPGMTALLQYMNFLNQV